MIRPLPQEILKPLKPFQRRTVDHAFRRLFLDADSTSRFLVADEVGLGKTLVARGIIARAIDHLWEDVDRIDIVYICSNAGIARANLPKLQIGGASERSFALATRLTMLATELAPADDGSSFMESKLNFVSFTPGTSFEMGHSGGRRREREVLFHLLAPHVDRLTPLMNLLQGWVTKKDGWRRGLETELPIEPTIRRDFDEEFERRDDLQLKLQDLLDNWFHRYRREWPDEARWGRDELIGELRRLLAAVCIRALEPDLVILDEFQRFKPLIETREDRRSPAAELAQSLFQTKAHDGRPVPTLLLSATPYKLYTTDAEIEQEDHYEDFLATTRFLFDGRESRVETLASGLARFANALKRATPDDSGSLQAVANAKTAVENALRAVMARTERVAASDERDAMLREPGVRLSLKPADVRQYLAADALFEAVGDRDPMPFWKSAPYLVHFMRGYKFNERLDETIELSPSKVASVLGSHRSSFLSAESLHQWSEIDPAHPKMREMVSDQLDRGVWRLLWVPPTLPYWPLEGPFHDKAGVTKTLLFSAWNVVPDVVSAVLSYEAERRMTGGRIRTYMDPARQQVPLLRLTQSAARVRSRHRLLRAVRLQAEGAPDAPDRRVRKAAFLGHRAQRPMGGARRRRAERPLDNLGHLIVRERSRPSRPRLIRQPLDARLQEAPAPLADRVLVHADLGCHRLVRAPSSAMPAACRPDPSAERPARARPPYMGSRRSRDPPVRSRPPRPAGRAGRRPLGMGGAPPSRSRVADLPGGMAGRGHSGDRRRRSSATTESGIVRRLCRRPPRP